MDDVNCDLELKLALSSRGVSPKDLGLEMANKYTRLVEVPTGLIIRALLEKAPDLFKFSDEIRRIGFNGHLADQAANRLLH